MPDPWGYTGSMSDAIHNAMELSGAVMLTETDEKVGVHLYNSSGFLQSDCRIPDVKPMDEGSVYLFDNGG